MLADSGEEVAYLPLKGAERTILAIIERGDAVALPGVGGLDAATPSIRVTVANDAEKGIASSGLDTGGDRIRVAVRIGAEEARTMEIARLVYHDAGALVVELR